MSQTPVLTIEDLRTYFYSRSKEAFVRSVDGVSLQINKGETLGIVGESGSGKSMTSLSVMGLVDAEPGVIAGKVSFKLNGTQKELLQDLDRYVKLNKKEGRIMEVAKNSPGWRRYVDRVMQGVRGKEIAMIFQNPKASLNPFISIGKQITESVMLNTGIKDAGEARVKDGVVESVGQLPSPSLARGAGLALDLAVVLVGEHGDVVVDGVTEEGHAWVVDPIGPQLDRLLRPCDRRVLGTEAVGHAREASDARVNVAGVVLGIDANDFAGYARHGP